MKPWQWFAGCAMLAAALVFLALCLRYDITRGPELYSLKVDRLTGRTWILDKDARLGADYAFWRELN